MNKKGNQNHFILSIDGHSGYTIKNIAEFLDINYITLAKRIERADYRYKENINGYIIESKPILPLSVVLENKIQSKIK